MCSSLYSSSNSASFSDSLPRLQVACLSHRYRGADIDVLDSIDLTVRAGEIHYLLGPSGCGKTTLLRLIAGLEPLQQGMLKIAGEDSGGLPPHKRRIGLVFQDHALFPNMTTRQNIAFGLRSGLKLWQGLSREACLEIDTMLLRFGLDAVAHRYPHQLSGGQQQRVGIARALIAKPALLLLDEPFSSLDSRTKDQVRDDILHLLQATRTSALIVSHDPHDALHMADRVTILTPDGRVAQSGTPSQIYFHPVSAYVASFLTEINVFPATVDGDQIQTHFGVFQADTPSHNAGHASVVVRPEAIKLLPAPSEAQFSSDFAQVVAARILGSVSQIHLRTVLANGAEIHIHVRENGVYLPKIGSLHRLVIDKQMAHVFFEAAAL